MYGTHRVLRPRNTPWVRFAPYFGPLERRRQPPSRRHVTAENGLAARFRAPARRRRRSPMTANGAFQDGKVSASIGLPAQECRNVEIIAGRFRRRRDAVIER